MNLAFLDVFVVCGLAYILGSLPTALWLGKLLKGIDIRQHGSGNAGATNAFRVLGAKPALFVLLVDMGKGLLAVTWISQVQIHLHPGPEIAWQIMAGLAAVAGHIWSVFAGFRGGKGVGTAAGMFFGLMPAATLGSLLLFAVIVARLRLVSLGSICAAAALPLFYVLERMVRGFGIDKLLLAVALLVAVLILFTHRTNIHRLRRGEEAPIVSGGAPKG